MIYLGFAFFGLVIGYITGITHAEITAIIISALFTFLGGKLFVDLDQKAAEYIRRAGIILTVFSLAFLIGLNSGIYIKIHRCFYQGTKANQTVPANDQKEKTPNSEPPELNSDTATIGG